MANFLDNNGLHTFVNSIKMWVVTNLNEWWKMLKVGHSYLDSNTYSTDENRTQWIYSVETVENTDSTTSKKFPLIPKISFHSTDWKYSKWMPTSSDNPFPFPTGPARSMVARKPYQSYYTKNMTVKPSTGDISGITTCKASSFSTMFNKKGMALTADGSYIKIPTITDPLTCNVNLKQYMGDCLYVSFTLSNDDRNILNGTGMGNDISFFKTNDGILFERMSRDYTSTNWTYGNFVGRYINESKHTVETVMADLDWETFTIKFYFRSNAQILSGGTFSWIR